MRASPSTGRPPPQPNRPGLIRSAETWTPLWVDISQNVEHVITMSNFISSPTDRKRRKRKKN